jgi:hypothetical protein
MYIGILWVFTKMVWNLPVSQRTGLFVRTKDFRLRGKLMKVFDAFAHRRRGE